MASEARGASPSVSGADIFTLSPVEKETGSTAAMVVHVGAELAPRPWVRYWARGIDVAGFFSAIKLPVLVLFPSALTHIGAAQAANIALLVIIIPLEAQMLHVFGTTPGKWLLQVSVKRKDYRLMTFRQALIRSARVWWRGLGAGMPIINAITMAVANRKLNANKITSWDKDGGTVVVHGKIGFTRAVVTVLLIIAISFPLLAEY